jgi:hypothetical protein
MRRYLLPAAVCAALGAIVILLVKRGGETRQDVPEEKPQATRPPPARPSPFGTPAQTTTALHENKYLRELERALNRDDLSHAHDFRQKVCEQMGTILASEKLTKNLLDLIRKYGADSDDPRRRDVVLPMLRILDHPDATRMIGEEYYQALDDNERILLLEAMAKPFHDPEQASVWAVERALHAETEEHRIRALDVITQFAVDSDIIVRTAVQIHDGSTDAKQREQAMKVICNTGEMSERARDFLRRALANPTLEEIQLIAAYMPNWGDENDAARLEALVDEFPTMAHVLREQANMVRDRIAMQKGAPPDMERRVAEEEERRRREEEEKKARGEDAESGG